MKGIVSTSIGQDRKWRFGLHEGGRLWRSVLTFDSQDQALVAGREAIKLTAPNSDVILAHDGARVLPLNAD